MMKLFDLLQKLSETNGPSGAEDRIAAVVAEIWEPLTDAISVDRIGSVIATKRGAGEEPRPRLLLAAHLDEVGLIVTKIVESNGNGFLRVTSVGGVDIRHLYAQNVVIHGRRDLPGIMGSLPSGMLPRERRSKPYGFTDLLVDPALSMKELEEMVSVGDFISFQQSLRKLLGGNVAGKALDNRASVAALTVCLERLAGRAHAWDVIAAATAQEETRLLGAYTSAFAQMPDAAIALDVTFAKGAAVTDATAVELNSGPVLEIGPTVHPGIFDALKKAAQSIEMDVSIITHTRASGTDAAGLQVARSGIPTGLVTIPLRYMHTTVEMINLKDVERAGRLLAAFIADLDTSFLDDIKRQLMA
jgi:putative aminopeptidase FrvX